MPRGGKVIDSNYTLCAIVDSYHCKMNSKHKKTLESIFSDPVNGNLEWARIEALLVAAGCRAIEGRGSSVMFEKDGLRAYFHRPHPGKAALKYRVRLAREYLEKIGVTP